MNIALIGPIPPPAGGMARQTKQQQLLLEEAGQTVLLIPTNMAYKPEFIAKIPMLRAIVRLLQYLFVLLTTLPKADVIHMMSNSGWSWHLFSTPAIIIAKLFGIPVVINYRGGEAAEFFDKQWVWVKPFIKVAQCIVVPSRFLVEVFGRYNVKAQVIPNTLNTEVFNCDNRDDTRNVIFVARNLEAIYGVDVAINAFKLVLESHPEIELVIAGSGPQENELKQLVISLGIEDKVMFAGRLTQSEMAGYYKKAKILLNPSKIDNSPNAIIEGLACGACVISSDVGGIPYLIEDGVDGVLVNSHCDDGYAKAICEVLSSPSSLKSMTKEGKVKAQSFDKVKVIQQWLEMYQLAIDSTQPKKGGGGSMFKLLDSMATTFIANVLFPLHEILKKHTTVAAYRSMMNNQWRSPAALEAYQNRELQAFVKTISTNVPYYKELFKAQGIDPATIRSKADLQKLPFLTKSEIRSHTDALKTNLTHQLSQFNTGGSSGEPLIFFIGNERVSHDVAAKWRATRWWDVNIGDREIVLWGSPIELGKQDKVKVIRDKLFRTELISAFALNDATKMHILNEIKKRQPPMLFGYPSVYAMLAEYAEQNGIKLSDSGVKVIFVTSEKLYDHQRDLIQKVFNAPVANGYGGRDAGFIAHECPKGNMHITADDIVVEIVDTDGRAQPNGVAGEIVVTHLRTSEFPFVRYKTGDIGVISDEKCSCGRGLPVLKEVQGRTTDFIVAADGTQMHGLALIYHVRDVLGVKNFKIVQENLHQTNLLLETNEEFVDSSIEVIRNDFKKRLGEKVSINIEIVDEIPSEKSGKYRYVISKVRN